MNAIALPAAWFQFFHSFPVCASKVASQHFLDGAAPRIWPMFNSQCAILSRSGCRIASRSLCSD